ncbi:hypothetical protein N599_10310 [Saccharopolyspora erythraea D]|nr:hypothetical protein N599_10310 [Saccharopolyspora erythraea D]
MMATPRTTSRALMRPPDVLRVVGWAYAVVMDSPVVVVVQLAALATHGYNAFAS